MLEEALGNLNLFLEFTQADITIEYHAMEIIRTEILVHHYFTPILGPAHIVLEHLDLFLCQLSEVSHKVLFVCV
jgi:hypothetical protein